ncbi:MAG: hypothetical protein WAU23_04195 [Ferruginibacter sp.]
MEPIDFYKQNVISLQHGLEILNKRKSKLAWLRFAAIAGIAACWYFMLPLGLWFVLVPVFLLLLTFTRLVYTDLKNKSAITHQHHLITVNQDELKALDHNYYSFEEGSQYANKEHVYIHDLDIFGHASLYQYINRTRSEMGSNTLADWLSAPAKIETIKNRQEAIKELSAKTRWRQTLQALGAAQKINMETQHRLQSWFDEEHRFLNTRIWMLLRYLVPSVLISVIILNMADVLNNYTRNYCLLAAALLAFYISKKVTPLHQQVSKMTEELEVLKDSIKLIEETEFTTSYLQDLKNHFKQQDGKASARLNKLKGILERLDLRFNFVVFIPLDILLQWDLQQVIALEKWKEQHKNKVSGWFTALGEFEAISSLSTLAYNHPHWCFPVFKKDHFFIEGKEIGHPLLTAATCVTNPLHISAAGELMLVTGSNMAGKSTYLRSIGINTVLAMAGSPVCAKYFCLSPVQIISSMRVTDNLEESTSTFYAELKKLKTVIDKVNNKEKIFILLDEILRGTNSLDRHTGSAALIRQLIKHEAVGIIATHDVELAKMKEEFPENMLNYHFDVQVNGEELYFDYRLKEGICTSLNASILMKKIGIEL